MRFYLIWTKYGAIWYAHISSSWAIGSGGTRFSNITVPVHRTNPHQLQWTVFHPPSAGEIYNTLHYNIFIDCVVQNWLSVYMDSNMWLKFHLYRGTYNNNRLWLDYFILIALNLKYAQIIKTSCFNFLIYENNHQIPAIAVIWCCNCWPDLSWDMCL